MNSITLIGNVGTDPEIKEFGDTNKVAEFSLATNRKFTKADGSKAEETTWFRCKVWGKRADVIRQYVTKGDKLAVQGRVSIRKDDEGRFWTEVIVQDFHFLGSPRGAKPATAGVGAPSPTEAPGDDLPW
jgi:single-strand DNA-binding protein